MMVAVGDPVVRERDGRPSPHQHFHRVHFEPARADAPLCIEHRTRLFNQPCSYAWAFSPIPLSNISKNPKCGQLP